MTKWSEILSQETLDLSIELEARAQAEREVGKKICPAQD